MIIHRWTDLTDFKFWGGACDVARLLTDEELKAIAFDLENLCDFWTETEINDIFWHDVDYIAKFLGYVDENDFWKDRMDFEGGVY